ncbi:MAG TPA: Asp-tRNA(Asn)/Glu-tRNA(Gln) amidotransferase subunit GatB [Polyangiaceae bacterium]|nr:Asp-tRNA(Asn)/Glu-tRNA(Gln) amidotransferase subunit GatB [Polyangiaceae bacterium]
MTVYEPVIGLEVHAQLLTATKLFCGCSVTVGSDPNQNVCPVCLGLPGSLPVGNRRAVELGVRAALALSCTISGSSIFARKNYFYPDLPKGYQISQFEEPFSTQGWLEIELEGTTRRAQIQRVHLEEDAGKNVHAAGSESLVDLNRAGTPLVEIVGAPDLRSSAEAAAYLRALREILMFVGANDGNLEEGSFRCDANVSLRPVGTTTLGTRTELKNINSFRYVQRAIDVEIARQTAILDSGGRVEQQTRSFDPESGQTRPLRSKADAHDYRYFPEPDLPPLVIEEGLIRAAQARIGELPLAMRRRWVSELGLSPAAAATLTQHPEYAKFFHEVCARFPQPVKVANWIQTEVLRDTTSHGLSASFPVSVEQVAELLGLVDAGKISGAQAKKIHAALVGTSRSPSEVLAELGLSVVSDAGELRPLCQQVLDQNPKNVAAYRSGKRALLGFFVGQVMKQSGGRANPELVNRLLTELLGPVEGS